MNSPNRAIFFVKQLPDPTKGERTGMRIDDQLEQVIDRCVKEHGTHLIHVSLRGERGKTLLQVFIDGNEPVTIDQCSQVSRALSGAIAQEQLLPGSYRLEVSTPGVDRPLSHPWQYPKHKGRTLRLVTGGGDQTRTLEGILTDADGEGIELSLADGSRSRFHFSTIIKATILTPW